MRKNVLALVFLLVCFEYVGNAQEESLLQSRKQVLTIGTTCLWVSGTAGLYYLWYDDYPSSPFHAFNDNGEWLQMDKSGHFFTAAVTAAAGYESFTWAGYDNKRALWIGGSMGWLFLSTLEVLDGLNSQWGFSWGDILANTAGSLFYILQQKNWQEQRIQVKASFHTTNLPSYRPDLLGAQWYEQLLKDYNGQTYWLSINPSSFIRNPSPLPPWFNIALGYGATGMLGGRSNPLSYQGHNMPVLDRERRFFLSPDISLSRLPIKNKTLKVICKTLDFIKIPLPALEYNTSKGWLFHGLYF